MPQLHAARTADRLQAAERFANPPIKLDGRSVRGRKRQIAMIEAARDLFIAHGYRGTTLEAIIARAGGSRETIYRVFGGKRGLFGAVIARVGEQLASSVIEPSALDLAPREALTRFAFALVAIWQSDEGHAVNRVVISEGLDAPEIVDAWYEGGTRLSIEALAQYLAVQQRCGTLTDMDPLLVARQFVTLLIGEMTFPLIAGVPAPPTSVGVGRCVDLILRANQRSF